MAAQQILQGGGDEEVFLAQAQFLPGFGAVAGYSTREILSARTTSATAPKWSPALKRSRCKSSMARARHRRKVFTLAPRQPTTGVS
jgi:hypothetical protein